MEKDHTDSFESGLLEIYKRLRPGEPANVDNARSLFENLFFDPKRYDLAHVGRYKLNKKLGARRRLRYRKLAEHIVDTDTGEIIVEAGSILDDQLLDTIYKMKEPPTAISVYSDDNVPVRVVGNGEPGHGTNSVTRQDIVAVIGYLLNLTQGMAKSTDIDHLGNRRLRSVGELLQNQFR